MRQTVQVPDMACEGCEKTIREALSKAEGVEKVEVDLPSKTVTVEGEATRTVVIDTIRAAGYSPE